MNEQNGYRAAGVFFGVWLLATSASAGELSGALELGVRDVNQSGTDYKYDQHVNLESGARLFGLRLDYQAPDAAAGAPDRVTVDAGGMGGDPYEWLRVSAESQGRWKANYERRESAYVYEDLLFDPASFDVEASIGGDFHVFDFTRVRESADLEVDFSDRGTVSVGFSRSDKSGDSTTVLDVSREEFVLPREIDESLETIDLQFDYRWDNWSITLSERFREFDNRPEVSIDGLDEGLDFEGPTQLVDYRYSEPYTYDSREHQLAIRARPLERLTLHANVLFSELDMDVDSSELTRGTSFLGTPLRSLGLASGDSRQDIWQLFLSSAFTLNDHWRLTLSVREQRLDQSADLASGAGADDGEAVIGLGSLTRTDWDLQLTQVRAGAEWIRGSLSAAGGVSQEWRDVDTSSAVVAAEPEQRVKTDSTGLWVKLAWRPNQHIAVIGSIEDSSIDDPYALASATDSRRYRLRASLRNAAGLRLSASWTRRERDNSISSWRSVSDHTSLRAGIAKARFSASVGASFVALDQDIDAVVRGGFRVDQFAIDYEADADFVDAQVTWRPIGQLELQASYRDYENTGSIAVARDDLRLAANYQLSDRYALNLGYRGIDFSELPAEAFDADLWELSLQVRW